MTVKTRALILAEIITLINDNTSEDITPLDLRTVLNDLADSMLNPSSDGTPSSIPVYREVTAAGAITVVVGDDIIGVNKTAGAATTVNLGLASARAGKVLVVKDVKGDADVNNITPVGSGGELIDGLAPSAWAIVSPKDSLKLLPITGGWLTIP